MATRKNVKKAKTANHGKRLTQGKQMKEVKPLTDLFLKLDGIKGESQ